MEENATRGSPTQKILIREVKRILVFVFLVSMIYIHIKINSSPKVSMFKEILEVITVGFSFCIFKIIVGLHFYQYWLVILGLIDLVINLTNFFNLTIFKRRLFDACFFAVLIHYLKKPSKEKAHQWMDLGNSLDVVLSFSLVAFMIIGAYLKELTPNYLHLWNLAVILNVFGAGSSRLTSSIKNLKGY
jgi:hypothetical protein